MFLSVSLELLLYLIFFFVFLFYLFYVLVSLFSFFFFFKQKTAYELRISDWSSDVCSSDLCARRAARAARSSWRSPVSTPPPVHGAAPAGSALLRADASLHRAYGSRQSVRRAFRCAVLRQLANRHPATVIQPVPVAAARCCCAFHCAGVRPQLPVAADRAGSRLRPPGNTDRDRQPRRSLRGHDQKPSAPHRGVPCAR